LLLRFNSFSAGSGKFSSNFVSLLRCKDSVTRLVEKRSRDLGNSLSKF
jgi:hypothetical protein